MQHKDCISRQLQCERSGGDKRVSLPLVVPELNAPKGVIAQKTQMFKRSALSKVSVAVGACRHIATAVLQAACLAVLPELSFLRSHWPVRSHGSRGGSTEVLFWEVGGAWPRPCLGE